MGRLNPGPLPPWYPRGGPVGAPQDATELAWQDLLTSSPAATSSGIITATFPPVAAGRWWIIDRLVVSSTSSVQTVASLYDGDIGPNTLLGATAQGNLDYDSTSGLRIDGGKTLSVQWTGASQGAVGTARVQLRIFQA